MGKQAVSHDRATDLPEIFSSVVLAPCVASQLGVRYPFNDSRSRAYPTVGVVPIPDHPIKTLRCRSVVNKSLIWPPIAQAVSSGNIKNVVEKIGCAWQATTDNDEQYCSPRRYDSATFHAVDVLGDAGACDLTLPTAVIFQCHGRLG
jgi:hypothetical protein